MIDIIDAIGGIELSPSDDEVRVANNYVNEMCGLRNVDASAHQYTAGGEQHVDGYQAVAYARIRYVGNSDYQRTERQREVIQAILDKAKKANIATLNKAANTIFEEISTSMTFTEITELLTDVASYTIGETGGFPAEQYRTTGDVHGASCVMSTDLTSDVLYLHQFLFGDVGDYQPSSEVQSIAARVHSDTGK